MDLGTQHLRNEDMHWTCPLCGNAHEWKDMAWVGDAKALTEGRPHRALIDKACFQKLKEQDRANGEEGRHWADHECTPATPVIA